MSQAPKQKRTPPLETKLGGKVYKLFFVPRSKLGKDTYGDCDPPELKKPKIRVAEDLSPLKTLDIVIHESLHASAWELLSEEWIAETASNIARTLDSLGWKRESNGQRLQTGE